MRVFFALPLPEQLKLNIEQWRNNNLPPSINHVPAANFHITLAFIGNIRDSDIELLCERTNEVVSLNNFKSASLNLIETGYWAKPEILWIGPRVWPDNLTQLANKLQNIGRHFGAKKDKRDYRPHLTLSKRIQSPSYPTENPNFCLDYHQITLYQSVSMKSGIKYLELEAWRLLNN